MAIQLFGPADARGRSEIAGDDALGLAIDGRRAIPAAVLDPFLDVGPETFPRVVDRLVQRLDEADVSIVYEPSPRTQDAAPETAWRASPNLLSVHRREVARIPPMTREEELRLGRRFDFARRRYVRALGAWGVEVGSPPRRSAYRWFRSGCGAETTPGDPRCLFAGFPAEGAAVLHARRREFDAARSAMVERSLQVVLRRLPRWRALGISDLDLVQEGSLGLFRAVEGYEWWRGVRFSTYAAYWVTDAFLGLLYRSGRQAVRIPAHLQKGIRRIDRARRFLEADPSTEEIARTAGLEADFVRLALRWNRRSLSLDREFPENDPMGGSLLERLADPRTQSDAERLDGSSRAERLRSALETLEPRERWILRHRFGLYGAPRRTLAELGRSLGISLERVRQIQQAALRRMRSGPAARMLAPLVA